MYFNEVIRLHLEERLGEDSIATRVPLGHTTVGQWIKAYKEGEVSMSSLAGNQDLKKEIQKMYASGMSIRSIARVTGLSKSTICHRISNFASEKENVVMKNPKEQSKDLLEAQRKIKRA